MASVVEFDLGLVQQITDHVDGVRAVPSCQILSFTLSKVSGASTSSVTVSDDVGDFAFSVHAVTSNFQQQVLDLPHSL